MAASYPSSVKNFSTRANGQTIADTWFNGLQDEVSAVESGLLTGLAHTLKPDSAGGRDLGTTALPFGNVYVTGLPMDLGLCEGRLTLTSGTPVTTADVTAAGTIYWTPYKGNRVALYDGTNWALYAFQEVSLALTLTSGKPYDIWLYNNAGVLTLESLVWTNDTTRATALALQNGVYVKSGATTRRYLGTIYASGANTTEDSLVKRYVWNYTHRLHRPLYRSEAATTWTYNTATIRQANANTANQVDFVTGVSEDMIEALVKTAAGNATTGIVLSVGIGLDTTTAFSGAYGGIQNALANGVHLIMGSYRGFPGVGHHYLSWNEFVSVAGGNTTFFNNSSQSIISAIEATIRG